MELQLNFFYCNIFNKKSFFLETDIFLKNAQMLNKVDDIMHLQRRFEKFQLIKESHRTRRKTLNKVNKF